MGFVRRVITSALDLANLAKHNANFADIETDLNAHDGRISEVETEQAAQSERIDNIVASGGESNIEIVDARQDYDTLRDRLDTEFGGVNALLAEEAQQREAGLNTKRDKATPISSADFDISSDEAKTGLANLKAEVIAAIAGSGVTISPVIAPNSVNQTGITERGVSRQKTDYYARTTDNMLDPLSYSSGYWSPSNGSHVADSGYKNFPALPVNSATSYRTNAYSLIFQDINYGYLSGMTASVLTAANGVFAPPAGAAYVRLNFVSNASFPVCAVNSHNYLAPYMPVAYADSALRLQAANVTSDFLISPVNADFFDRVRTVNMFNPYAAVPGRYNETGAYSYNAANPQATSDFIPVAEGERWRTTSSGYVTFYAADKNLTGGLTPTNDITIPAGASFMRTTTFWSTRFSEMVVKADALPSVFVPYYEFSIKPEYLKAAASSKLFGKKWNTLGDSITEAAWGGFTKYDALISTKYGVDLSNYGEGGTRIAYKSDRPRAFVERFGEMRDDADIITVFGGTNDYSAAIPLGDISSMDTGTFYGALNVLCAGLIDKYPGKAIGFITPIQRRGYNVATFMSYVNAEKEVCAKYSIPVLDLTTSGGLCPDIDSVRNTLFYDDVHPNGLGQGGIASRVSGFLESLIM